MYIISGTLDYLREQYAMKCVRYRFFGITFEVACYGGFETADAKFDPSVNSLEVAVRLGDEQARPHDIRGRRGRGREAGQGQAGRAREGTERAALRHGG